MWHLPGPDHTSLPTTEPSWFPAFSNDQGIWKDPRFNLCLSLLVPVPLASSCGTPRARLILSPTMLQILLGHWLVEDLDLRRLLYPRPGSAEMGCAVRVGLAGGSTAEVLQDQPGTGPWYILNNTLPTARASLCAVSAPRCCYH